MTIELVTWLDAETRDAWREHGEAETDSAISDLEAQAIGWVIVDNDERLVLASRMNDRSYASTITIPKVAVTQRVVLEEQPAVVVASTYTAAFAETHGA